MLPIVAEASVLALDNLQENVNYLVPYSVSYLPDQVSDLQSIADAAHSWYHTHNWSCQTQLIATQITALTNASCI
jgi:hypothetical protein